MKKSFIHFKKSFESNHYHVNCRNYLLHTYLIIYNFISRTYGIEFLYVLAIASEVLKDVSDVGFLYHYYIFDFKLTNCILLQQHFCHFTNKVSNILLPKFTTIFDLFSLWWEQYLSKKIINIRLQYGLLTIRTIYNPRQWMSLSNEVQIKNIVTKLYISLQGFSH